MNLMYIDLLSPIGHKTQNKCYINLLAKYFDVYVTCPKNWYDGSLNANVIEDNKFLIGKGKFKARFNSIRSLIKNCALTKIIKPDYIFISSYDTMIMALFIHFLKKTCKNRLKILHHINVDEINNKIKRFFFKTYMNKVDHVVFEEFIEEYLINEISVNKKNIFVLPHQLNIKDLNNKKQLYDCVALSESNSESSIYKIIKNEILNSTIKNNNKKIILKSKLYEYDNGALKVIMGYLDDNEYNRYIANTLYVYMPFSLNFNYRMSGTLVDALSNNKIVLGSNIKLLKYYSKKYPHICKIVNNEKDLIKIINEIEKADINTYLDEFLKFRYNHSDKVIENIFISNIFKK